ncbi:MAG: hypothetical protein HQ567_33725 [Candidatus Nealsonbacteria bacterium]|nr:hypothetical protein [Candidatus Nealsonbacteria bacterium]
MLCCVALSGCGTTKWTDTRRTATEQLLVSDAMERAVAGLDFRAVASKKVYLDSKPLSGVTDSAYLVSTLRQHMLASGCQLMDAREAADYIAEVRAGAVGTDRSELTFGVPATQIPAMLPVPGLPPSLPEMPLATRTEQRAVVKIAVFCYNRHTGRPIWQSGIVPVESRAKDIWLLGAGPFQRGNIYEGTSFAGGKIKIPLVPLGEEGGPKPGEVSVADEAYFHESVPERALAAAAAASEAKAKAASLAAATKAAEAKAKAAELAAKSKEAVLAAKTKEAAAAEAKANEAELAAKTKATDSPKAVVPAGHTEPAAKKTPAKAADSPNPVVPASHTEPAAKGTK